MRTHVLSVVGLLVILTAVAISDASNVQDSPINVALAGKYFKEAEGASSRDGARLWGVTLYGPMLFADPDTRFVVANQADKNGALRREGEVFAGKLPEDIGIANTAVTWSGVQWTMVVWPMPEERQGRVRLMTHELFHRVQEGINLPASDVVNRQLDQKDGRIWLRLELRALERALYEQGAARKEAITDAIYFRHHRQSLFPQAAKDEAALEVNEGLAEYTGVKLSSRSDAEGAARAGYALRQAVFRQSFARSFAYATGPAYGLLLDAAQKNWRRNVKAGSDLSMMLQAAMNIRLPPNTGAEVILARANLYDGDEIIAGETERENHRRETAAKYRARLLEGPVLVVPVKGSFHYTFDPNNVTPLDDTATIYPTLRVTDEWGILEVSDGALMFRDNRGITKLHVTAPADIQKQPVQGSGWKLTLNDGWKIVAGERKGDFVIRKDN